MIAIDLVQSTAETLMKKAAIEIPDDYLNGLKAAAAAEDGDLSSFVLDAMLENYEAAREDSRAMCGDTGCPRWYVKMGNEARVDGGPIALEAALRRATATATSTVPLRPNRVHPLWRTDHGAGLDGRDSHCSRRPLRAFNSRLLSSPWKPQDSSDCQGRKIKGRRIFQHQANYCSARGPTNFYS